MRPARLRSAEQTCDVDNIVELVFLLDVLVLLDELGNRSINVELVRPRVEVLLLLESCKGGEPIFEVQLGR